MTVEEKAKFFKALSDERRLKILELLQGGEKCACILIENMKMPQSSLSYHMKILCEAGIVKSREEGKWTYYQLSPHGIEQGIKMLRQMTQFHTSYTGKCNCNV